MKKCFICDKILEGSSGHVQSCAKKNNLYFSKDEIRRKQIEFEHNIIISKEEIYQYYVIEEKSLPELYEIYGIGFSKMQSILRSYGIPIRSIKDSNKNRMIKIKNTLQEMYGVRNISQIESVKQKKRESCIKKYGVDNIRKSAEFKEWLQNYMMEKYGKKSITSLESKHKNLDSEYKKAMYKKLNLSYKKWYNNLSDEEKNELLSKQLKFLEKGSKLETRISEILLKYGISHQRQFYMSRRSYDIRISNTRVLIEVNGDFWHANPKWYKKDDLINHPGKQKKVSEIWQQDKEKIQLAFDKGFIPVIIWECEINKKSDSEIFDLIMERIDETSKNQINKKISES